MSFRDLVKGVVPQRLRQAYRRIVPVPLDKMFTEIYASNTWGSSESKSGDGSTEAQTSQLRLDLQKVLTEHKIRSILDIPCGDFNWMRHLDLEGIDYHGADIVPALVNECNERYSRPGVRFSVLDLTRDDLPTCELVFCRDCLVHLPNSKVLNALQRIKNSGALYLMSTTFPKTDVNLDIAAGRWRPINLTCAPFSLPKPLSLFNENCPDPGHEDKSMGFWRIDALATS